MKAGILQALYLLSTKFAKFLLCNQRRVKVMKVGILQAFYHLSTVCLPHKVCQASALQSEKSKVIMKAGSLQAFLSGAQTTRIQRVVYGTRYSTGPCAAQSDVLSGPVFIQLCRLFTVHVHSAVQVVYGTCSFSCAGCLRYMFIQLCRLITVHVYIQLCSLFTVHVYSAVQVVYGTCLFSCAG